MDLQGLRLVAVGGASGMAKATAERVVAGGGKVAVLDRAGSDGAAVAAALGGTYHESDVTDFEGTERALGEAIAALGGVDAVVNTAGGGVAVRTIVEGRADAAGDVPAGHRPQPDRDVQHRAPRGVVDEHQRAQRRRRARRDHQHRVDRRVRGSDRPGRLHRGQGRHRRHVADDGARPRVARHPRQHDRAEPVRHRPHRRHPEGVRGPAHRRRRVPEAHGPARRVRARSPSPSSRTRCSTAAPSASTAASTSPPNNKVASLQQVFAVRATQPRGGGSVVDQDGADDLAVLHGA